MNTPALGSPAWSAEHAGGTAVSRARRSAGARAAADGGERMKPAPLLSAGPPVSAAQRFCALLAGPAHEAPSAPQHPTDTAAANAGLPIACEVAAAPLHDRPHPKQTRPATPTTMPDKEIADLLDDVAELVCMHRSGRAQHWSVSVWLREAVLRDTQLALTGEPGRIDIRFSSTNPDSLRRLHARHGDLQARLHERIAVLHLRVAIESTHAGRRGEPGEPG